jgi:tRNA-specific 2-thiouridylase
MIRTTTTTTTTPTIEPAASAPAHDELASWAGRRVGVALSGGVDSAVAAWRLKAAGAEVVGLSLRLHDPDPGNPLAPRACCPPDDLQDARRVAEALDVPFYVVDGRADFEAQVVTPFVRDYLGGRTPNPCVGCNSFVKLERLARRARALGCAALATGHYARLAPGPRLLRGVDRDKDQSYFLFAVAPALLAELLFPLGAWRKAEVRDAALAAGLPVAHKLESQEVCFVGGAGAGGYVMRRPEAAGDHAGDIVDADGHVLGRHAGVMGFTVGQRRGIGIAARSPLHVLAIDAEARQVVVGPAEALAKDSLHAARAVWPAGRPEAPFEANVRIRYRDPGTPGTVFPGEDGAVRVVFHRPAKAVAPGQAVVFERGDEVVGGAWIGGAA